MISTVFFIGFCPFLLFVLLVCKLYFSFLFQGPKVTYIPPPPPEDEDSIFAHYQTGINFDKYDTILVEVSGHDAPPAILVSVLFLY